MMEEEAREEETRGVIHDIIFLFGQHEPADSLKVSWLFLSTHRLSPPSASPRCGS